MPAKAKRSRTGASSRTRKARTSKASKRTTRAKRKTTIGAVAKKARALGRTRLGKAAALLLAGAAAGAVRAAVPQLEKTAKSQEKIAARGKTTRKSRRTRASA